ncbi:TatD family hydrolase [Geoglobus acetivorans]|uniref:TatD family hydrolase n=1 Tax=Geoglobus acetivorans TaxID=565033 RepID=A0ABZ3H4R1_GEOAI|nr:TatD family hydrolase [Geoglobus acetivorans]
MIITDNHMHLYNHLRLKALKQFRQVGGTHVLLVSLLSHHYGILPSKGEDFRQIFEDHIKLVKKANEIVRAYAVLSVHPAEITILSKKWGVDRAAEIMMEALEIAGEYVSEGKAIAIKSGRPHYEVSEYVWRTSNEVLQHAFEVARDVGCVVQLHTESYTREGMEEIAKLADRAGLDREKIVKHFSPARIDEFREIGIVPSVIAMGDNILKAAQQGDRFMVETDYIDDRDRPGSVLGPKTVPRKIRELLQKGFDEDFVIKICKDNVERVYGIEIEI